MFTFEIRQLVQVRKELQQDMSYLIHKQWMLQLLISLHIKGVFFFLFSKTQNLLNCFRYQKKKQTLIVFLYVEGLECLRS